MHLTIRKTAKTLILTVLAAALMIPAAAQSFKPPATVLPDALIQAILGEISGQLPFDNEVVMAGRERIRTKAEFDGFFEEASYLAAKLKEYGLDQVELETLGRDDKSRGGWWVGLDAELWIKQPYEKRLSRLEENVALMTRGCDEGEWEGELVYLDRRDLPTFREKDFKGKIILTPEYAGYFSEAFKKGALGIISWNTPGKPYYDPDQVEFDMRMEKGGVKDKVFSFNIWRRLGDELKDLVFSGQKVVIKAKTKTANMPFKMDSVFAAIKGTAPDKKGLMFTAHLFERPAKIGANDNVSACVTLAEIARTLTRLIADGRIPRPERSIYFLMSEEGSGTMAWFLKHPEMAGKIFAAINMDMVGEDLDKNHAFFNIEVPVYSRMAFVEALTRNAAEYVFQTNIDKYSYHGQTPWIYFPVPIVEKNGTESPFRYTMSPFTGGSDHGVFLDSDVDIPAYSFNVWPDFWYHTDRDRPDKSDPTQLKRVSFIGAASALAACLGTEPVLERLIRTSYEDRLAFIKTAVDRGLEELSALAKPDGGLAFRNAELYVNQAVGLSRSSLLRIRDLTAGKPAVDKYLAGVTSGLDGLRTAYLAEVKAHYLRVAALNGFKPVFAAPGPDELKLKKMVSTKVTPLKLGDRAPYDKFSTALQGDQAMMMDIFRKYNYTYFMQLFYASDGKRSLADLRDMLSFEFTPVPAADFLKHVQALEKAGLIKIVAR